MSLALTGTASAIIAGLAASFLGTGGAEPYVYSVVPGGAGGTIDSDSGEYTAPIVAPSNPKLSSDTILVTDDDGDTATLPILITDHLGIVCEILQKELGLAPGRVYLWDQKIMQPTDSGLYVAVSVLSCKPFGNTRSYASSGTDSVQSVNMLATLSIDIISRSIEALRRKEEVLMALASQYSELQQERNSFFLGTLPVGGQFVNLSEVDGAAIPYRFNISINMQYFVRKVQAVEFYEEFSLTTETEA